MRNSTSRPPERRVQAIDRALRGGKWPTVLGLAVDLGVDPRTIRFQVFAPLRSYVFVAQLAKSAYNQHDAKPYSLNRAT